MHSIQQLVARLTPLEALQGENPKREHLQRPEAK